MTDMTATPITTTTQDGQLRIESGGYCNDTVITVDGKPVTNCVAVTWSIGVDGLIGKATLELDLTGVALDAVQWDYRKPTIRQRLAAAWFALTHRAGKR